MAKNASQTKPKLFTVWWGRALVALALLLAAYGFASLAIDSGNLLHYAISIALVWWAVLNIKSAYKLVRTH